MFRHSPNIIRSFLYSVGLKIYMTKNIIILLLIFLVACTSKTTINEPAISNLNNKSNAIIEDDPGEIITLSWEKVIQVLNSGQVAKVIRDSRNNRTFFELKTGAAMYVKESYPTYLVNVDDINNEIKKCGKICENVKITKYP